MLGSHTPRVGKIVICDYYQQNQNIKLTISFDLLLFEAPAFGHVKCGDLCLHHLVVMDDNCKLLFHMQTSPKVYTDLHRGDKDI